MSINVKFAGPAHAEMIKKIAAHYMNLQRIYRSSRRDWLKQDQVELALSLVVAQGQFNLDLEKLFMLKTHDFMSEIASIVHFINIETGMLRGSFRPASAR